MNKIILIIAIIVILVILLIVYKQQKFQKFHEMKFAGSSNPKQNGGMLTKMSTMLSSNTGVNVGEYADYIFNKHRSDVLEDDLRNVNENIISNLVSFEEKIIGDEDLGDKLDFLPRNILFQSDKFKITDLKTLYGGLAEAIVYLTNLNLFNLPDFDHNIIECYDAFIGSFNATFICRIVPANAFDVIHDEYTINQALRIKYNHRDKGDFVNYYKLINAFAPENINTYSLNPIAIDYFAVSIIPDFLDVNDIFKRNAEFCYRNPQIVYPNKIINTRWYLMDIYDGNENEPFDLNKYVEAIRMCANALHATNLLYRDWKLENFMIKTSETDWNYVLTDIDFDKNKEEYDFNLSPRTLRFTQDNKNSINNFINLTFGGKMRNVALDNLFAYLSALIESKNYNINYHYFNVPGSEITLNQIIHEFGPTTKANLLTSNGFYDIEPFRGLWLKL